MKSGDRVPLTSSGNSVISGLTYLTNEVDDATLIDMLKVAIESHCSEKTAVDNISIIDKSYSDGLNVIAEKIGGPCTFKNVFE